MQKIPVAVAAVLTWAAGFVDAVGFISLGHIYTANMSGNSVAVGIQWASHDWLEMVRRIWPVGTYVIGLLFCRILIQAAARARIKSVASIAFLIEIALLAPVLLASGVDANSGIAFAYVGLLAIAMGIQNAALTHFSSLTIHTGFVTGTLVKFAEEFTKYLTWSFDRMRTPGASLTEVFAQSPRQKAFQISFWLAAIWIAYVLGAYCGAVGDHGFQLRSLAVPMLVLLTLLAIDRYRPLAIREVQDQSKLFT